MDWTEIFQSSSMHSRAKRNLTNQQRQAIFEFLMMQSRSRKLNKGSISYMATFFSVDVKTIHRIWQQGKAHIASGLPVDLSSQLPKRVGSKRLQFDLNEIARVDPS